MAGFMFLPLALGIMIVGAIAGAQACGLPIFARTRAFATRSRVNTAILCSGIFISTCLFWILIGNLAGEGNNLLFGSGAWFSIWFLFSAAVPARYPFSLGQTALIEGSKFAKSGNMEWAERVNITEFLYDVLESWRVLLCVGVAEIVGAAFSLAQYTKQAFLPSLTTVLHMVPVVPHAIIRHDQFYALWIGAALSIPLGLLLGLSWHFFAKRKSKKKNARAIQSLLALTLFLFAIGCLSLLFLRHVRS